MGENLEQRANQNKSFFTKIKNSVGNLYYSMKFRLGLGLASSAAAAIGLGLGIQNYGSRQSDPATNLTMAMGAGIAVLIPGAFISFLRYTNRYDDWNTNTNSKWH